MKYFLPLVLLILLCLPDLNAQTPGTLTFNRALIVSNTEQTVGPDKVWKITAVYGIEGSTCVNLCVISGGGPDCSSRPFVPVAATSFLVNSVRVFSYMRQLTNIWYSSNNCTTGAGSYSITALSSQGTVIEPNPNALPMWLPEGTTLQSGGPATFVSVLEFDVH